jgi:hypothetical protein
VTGLLAVFQTVGLLLGGWVLVSVVAAAVVIPWLRRQARVNEALSRLDVSSDWAVAVHPEDVRPNAGR